MNKKQKAYINKVIKNIEKYDNIQNKFEYAIFYHFHINEADKEIGKRVKKYYEEAIALDYLPTLAYNNLGSMYDRGNFVRKNNKKLVDLYTKAIECIDYDDYAYETKAIACINLGCCYYYGKGTDINYDLAFKYYNLSNDFNNTTEALLRIGDCYRNGKGCEKNESKAFNLYQEAYDLLELYTDIFDRAELLHRIGRAYLLGEGTHINKNRGLDYLLEAKELYEIDLKRNENPYSSIGLKEINKLLKDKR